MVGKLFDPLIDNRQCALSISPFAPGAGQLEDILRRRAVAVLALQLGRQLVKATESL